MSVAGFRQSLLLWSVDYWNLEGNLWRVNIASLV